MLGGGGGAWRRGARLLGRRLSGRRGGGGGVRAGAAASSTGGSPASNAAGGEAGKVLKSALTSAGLLVVGDGLVQALDARKGGAEKAAVAPADRASRAARLGTFGFVFYGPFQHYWYAALERAFPSGRGLALAARVQPFAAKVVLNQVVLGPLVVSSIFAWTAAWEGKLAELPAKWRRDFKKTVLRGWTFWVPAATINFAVVPLDKQVLYMSCCGVVWSAILSAATA